MLHPTSPAAGLRFTSTAPCVSLPAELLQQTFAHLGERDLAVVSGTCRAWRSAALDGRLPLRRGRTLARAWAGHRGHGARAHVQKTVQNHLRRVGECLFVRDAQRWFSNPTRAAPERADFARRLFSATKRTLVQHAPAFAHLWRHATAAPQPPRFKHLLAAASLPEAKFFSADELVQLARLRGRLVAEGGPRAMQRRARELDLFASRTGNGDGWTLQAPAVWRQRYAALNASGAWREVGRALGSAASGVGYVRGLQMLAERLDEGDIAFLADPGRVGALIELGRGVWLG